MSSQVENHWPRTRLNIKSESKKKKKSKYEGVVRLKKKK